MPKPIDRIAKFFSSLRLTVVLLAFGILLVWVGTIAQADEGLYVAQSRYFKQWIVKGVTMFGHRLPIILPGGYLLGTLLLVNLVAAHIKRFQLTRKKLGIQLTHAGVILLLVGQLVTDIFSKETHIRFDEGQTKTYSESALDYELAVVTDADPKTEEVIAIPASLLAKGADIQNEKLPFTIHVRDYWLNSDINFRAPMMQNGPPLTTNGLAASFDSVPKPETHDMDQKNVPTSVIELRGQNGSLGDWVVSGWFADEQMVRHLFRSYASAQGFGPAIARRVKQRLEEPQVVQVAGRSYTLALRPTRTYQPYSLTLLKTTHSVYRGTDTPKDFRSRVKVDNHATGESRETEIFMNSPLRYQGQTFYQFQMDDDAFLLNLGERPSSALQVVRNPAWLTPYAGCLMVAAGLIIQFMIHLVGFISKQRTA